MEMFLALGMFIICAFGLKYEKNVSISIIQSNSYVIKMKYYEGNYVIYYSVNYVSGLGHSLHRI